MQRVFSLARIALRSNMYAIYTLSEFNIAIRYVKSSSTWTNTLRLTTYADFSLRLLMYLAVQGEGLSTIAEVAKSYGISQNHLVKVTHRLALEGYVSTTRGMNGGLRLARPAAEINVGEVVRRMEPDMALVPCMQPLSDSCPIVPNCLLLSAMEDARAAFLEVLDGYTLANLTAPRAKLRKLLSFP
jgi:Rrf2 family transcriptional regulator, nitric oxide-sensitive transcriptional repressor